MVAERFHRFFRNAGDAEVNIRIVCCKIKLIHGLTMFAIIVFLQLCAVLPRFQVSLSYREFGRVVLPWDTGLPGLSEELGSSCNTPTTTS